MKKRALENLTRAWADVRHVMSIRDEESYDRAVALMEVLLALTGEDENHQCYDLLDTLSTLILCYENEHYPRPPVRGLDVLRFFMDQHSLKQTDLPELGSQGVVSEVLRGKRKLNARQIEALRKRFKVPADVFFDDPITS